MLLPTSSLPPFLHPFRDGMWGDNSNLARSKEITPFYVERYCQPRSEMAAQGPHDYWEFIYVFGGRGTFRAASESFEVGPGASLLIPPGLPHGEYSKTLLDTLWVGLAGSQISRLTASCLLYQMGKREMLGHAERLWLLSKQKERGCGNEMDGLCRCILALMTRPNSAETASRLTGIERAIEHIHMHLAEPLSMSSGMAEVAGMSEGHFYRSFKRVIGATPLEYVVNQRLKQASRLLHETTLSVNRIAELVGYPDAGYFRRLFKTRKKMTPTEHREARA